MVNTRNSIKQEEYPLIKRMLTLLETQLNTQEITNTNLIKENNS